MKFSILWSAPLAAMVVLALAPTVANANPHALPFTYPYATLNEGQLELEQSVDLTPVHTTLSSGNGLLVPRAILTTELEYGITDHLELGLYVQMSDSPGGATTSGDGISPLALDGIKQRLRYRLGEDGQWPVNVALYGEVAELQNEFELEGKILLEKRIGKMQLLLNLWGEREFYSAQKDEWVANPTAGFSYELSPVVHLGAEYWMHAEYGGSDAGSFDPAPHHYAGPAVMFNWGKLWWSAAVYSTLNDWSHHPAIGEEFGKIWVRTMIGINL